MKKIIIGLAISLTYVTLSSPVFAQNNQYEIKTNPQGNSLGGSTDIEMRKQYDYDPSNKYRGEIDSDGSVRMKNYDGDRLRGTIDSDGYGRLRDQDGNTYRVKP